MLCNQNWTHDFCNNESKMTDSKTKKSTFFNLRYKYVIIGFKNGVDIFNSYFFVSNFDITNLAND